MRHIGKFSEKKETEMKIIIKIRYKKNTKLKKNTYHVFTKTFHITL